MDATELTLTSADGEVGAHIADPHRLATIRADLPIDLVAGRDDVTSRVAT